MAGFGTRFDSSRQDWSTPDDVFSMVSGEFPFTLDAAAAPETARAITFFTEAHEALSADWGTHIVWCNPPYGSLTAKLSDWVKKAHAAAQFGATVVLLLPARTNTSWFHDYCLRDGEVRFIRGRPKFGGADHGLPQPLCFVIFRPPMTPKCAARLVVMPVARAAVDQIAMEFENGV